MDAYTSALAMRAAVVLLVLCGCGQSKLVGWSIEQHVFQTSGMLLVNKLIEMGSVDVLRALSK